MKFWKSIIFVFLIVTTSDCGAQAPGGNFSMDGVSFSYPSGWSITEQEDFDGEGYYLSVEKSGFDASGLVTLTWVNGVLDLRDFLELTQEEIINQKIFHNLEFQSVREDVFNEIKCISCAYKFNTLGMKHRGVIYVFLKDKKTYSIMKQEAIEDISKNKNGFELIKATFKVE